MAQDRKTITASARPASGRRRFLKRAALGTGVVTVAVAGGVVWRGIDRRAFTSEAGPGFEPWASWKSDMGRGPIALVRAAILASSPHNTQPWLFRVANDRIDLLAHRARNLGSFDPYLREMHVGLGCALENMLVAAGPNGLAVRLETASGRLEEPGPQPGSVPVASLHLSRAAAKQDELFDAIPNRRTNRGHYDKPRGVSAAILTQLGKMASGYGPDVRLQLLDRAGPRDALSSLINRATVDITRDSAMNRDSENWFRFSPEAVDLHRDGVTLDSLNLPPFLQAMAKLMPAPDEETASQYWIDNTRDMHLGTAPVLAQILVRDLYDREQALQVGRMWQRLHLWATARGLAMHPINQAVEMVDRERQLDRPARYAADLAKLSGADWKPTFIFRIGYPKRQASRSPRRGVNRVVVGKSRA